MSTVANTPKILSPHGNKNMKYIAILIISTFVACFTVKDHQLRLERVDNQNSLIKLNGYYFDPFPTSIDSSLSILFLYSNGIVLDAGARNINELEDAEKFFKSLEFNSEIKKRKYGWGVYIIDNSKITIELWNAGEPPLKTFIHEGDILNDTTFHINEFYWSNKKGEIKQRDHTFHFKPFSPKPDSTNTFIN